MCAGLPILLCTIARALKDGDSSEWKDALEKLKRFDKDEMDGQVYSALELSYNSLKGDGSSILTLWTTWTLQHCNPRRIEIYCWAVGLGLLKRTSTLEEAGNRLHKLVNDLRASCLLLEGDADGRVRMHDVALTFATSVASRDHHVFTAAFGTVLKNDRQRHAWTVHSYLFVALQNSWTSCSIQVSKRRVVYAVYWRPLAWTMCVHLWFGRDSNNLRVKDVQSSLLNSFLHCSAAERNWAIDSPATSRLERQSTAWNDSPNVLPC